ncbi:MAG: mechanosensitive ion channel family protein [Pseudodesulfovibrio sp.]|jgi:small-conductance mechanosensitive channel|uniref:Mechanosensitive ion channel protein MscS n=1 Tax=Pseudodesulfovibrio indicus TaxID=1716143 RepID=A0A126QKI0_9BACT|nr:mechanosensitive ion channel domain-containing protein [Pseudodesulfovibrio indicus]AMK10494.1 mechanosensitive ion channel protein MscS [Pseudodesulfovibrio indicus]TDT89107.1 small-conductance mechanosensitive channel [Pseudodesulfovibrio indicus]
MPENVNLVAYLAGITFAALAAYLWLHARVTSFRESRVRRITKLLKDPETAAAMPTEVLSDSQERQERNQIIKGVRSRFTIIRRTLVLCVFVVWVMALTFPFIGKLPSTMLSIIIAVTTAVVGIAARPLVENMISGIVISFSRQLRVGDTLMMDGQYGTVEDISITHTKIKTWDWKRYVIPNSRMLNKEFVNLTLNDSLLWAYLEFSVSYEADLGEVSDIATRVAATSQHHNAQEPPQFWVMRMDKESVTCWVAAWADSPAEAWNLKSDIATRLIREFQERNIPTHMNNVNLAGAAPA